MIKIKHYICIVVLLSIYYYYYSITFVEKLETKYTNSKHVVLASWYLSQPDAQWKEPTHVVPSKTYAYMKNFYETVKILQLHVFIFHDSLSTSFVRMYETDKIIFLRTDGPPDHISPQDWRFFMYKRFLKKREFNTIIFADISDTFFFHDPFYYIKNHRKQLFITRDVGTLQSNLWMRTKFKYCYNMTKLKNLPVYNDGVWGGKSPVVYEFLDCFVKILRKKRPYENCNMMAMNICAHQTQFQIHMDDPTSISNPYLKQCDNNYYPIIHNKCIKLDPTGRWNDKCISVIHSEIRLQDCL